MTCRNKCLHALQGMLLGALIGHAITQAMHPQKPVGLRFTIRTSPESVHRAPVAGEITGIFSNTWDK